MKLYPLALILCFTACENPAPKNGVIGDGSWRLVEVAGQPVLEPSPQFADRPAPFLSLKQESGNGATKVTGYTGCNQFSRVMDLRDPDTDLQVQSTGNFCGEDMAVQERHIMEILSGYPRFAFDHDIQTVWITGEDGRQLVGKSIGKVRASPEGSWTVVEINGEPAPATDASAIMLEIDGTSISAVSQCIVFRWTYQVENAAMSTSAAPILDENGAPEPMCARGLSDAEKKFPDVIDDAISYGFNSSDQMVVSSPRGTLGLKKR